MSTRRPTLMRPSVLPSRWASPEAVGGWDQRGTGFLISCSVGTKGRAPSLLSAENLIHPPHLYHPLKEATYSTTPWGVLLGWKMNCFPIFHPAQARSPLLQIYWVPQTQVTSIPRRSMWLREVGSEAFWYSPPPSLASVRWMEGGAVSLHWCPEVE